MDNRLKIITNNITDIYKKQSEKIKTNWEYQVIWSYIDRLIAIQVELKYITKALQHNDKLFQQYTKGEI